MEEILSASQVAEILQINVKTVYRLAKKGLIPGNKVGGSVRFYRKHIVGLVSKRKSKLSRGEGDLKQGIKNHVS